MDANRFDEFARALGINAARRGIVAGLLGSGLASMLAALKSEACRRDNRHKSLHDELTAEKRNKCKKKKGKKRKKCKKGSSGDEAPPCTEDSCPLPPGCSQQTFDDCAADLIAAVQADAEACRQECEGGDSPTCRACLEPVLDAHLTAAEDCVVESCASSAPRTAERDRAQAQAGHAVARIWWERQCGKSTCCYGDWRGCLEDVRAAFADCLLAASIQCMSTPVTCNPAYGFCMAKLAYDRAKCDARFGCPGSETCGEGDICCARRHEPCGGGCCPLDAHCCPEGGCCAAGEHCCEGGGCCNNGDKCCRRGGVLHCCPPNAECMPTGIICCSNC